MAMTLKRDDRQKTLTGFEGMMVELFDRLAQQFDGGVVPEYTFYRYLRAWLKPAFARALVGGLVNKGVLFRPAPRNLARLARTPRRMESMVTGVSSTRISVKGYA